MKTAKVAEENEKIREIEKKLGIILAQKTIHGEVLASDRMLNILSMRSFYGDFSPSDRTLGGQYDSGGLMTYRASSDVLKRLARLGQDPLGAAIAAAIIHLLGIEIPSVVSDKFSSKTWEYLARIRALPGNADFLSILTRLLSRSRSSVKSELVERWAEIRDIFSGLVEGGGATESEQND